MTREELLAAAKRHRNKLRMQLGVSLCFPVVLVGCYAIWIVKLRDPLLLALGAALIIWSVVGQFFFQRLSPEAAGDYRGLVERRLEFRRIELLWSFGPIAAAIGFLIFATWRKGIFTSETWTRALPFLTLLVVWVVMYFVIWTREMRGLREELGRL